MNPTSFQEFPRLANGDGRPSRLALLVAVASMAATGCNSEQLRFTTLRLSQSIPEIQERQVIDNLARIAANPGNLPYYTVINVGTTNILDTGSGGLAGLTLQHKVYPSGVLNGTASRSVTGNWTLNPMVSPDRLHAMRAAYLIALGAPSIDPLDGAKLKAILDNQRDYSIPTGFLHVGGRRDAPRGACIVAHHCETYVWVEPRHVKQFTDFCLLMLNIATWAPPASKPHRLLGPEAPALESYGEIQPRLYEDSPSINRGLFFVPR